MPKKTDSTYGRRDFLTGSAAALVGAGLLGVARASKALAAPHRLAGDVATHNMLVVGEQTLFLSHLPVLKHEEDNGNLVTTPHRYELVVEETVTRGRNTYAQSAYAADRTRHEATKL